MNQDQDIDNDLQKAIDDITNTEKDEEPVFADPVAAPSTVPDGAADEMSDPIGPFEETPIAPIPDLGVPPMPAENDAMTALPTVDAPVETAPVAAPAAAGGVKGDALKALVPLLDKMSLDPSKKFGLIKLAYEEFHEEAMLEQALKAAQAITDDVARGEALLYIVEAK